MTNTTQPNLATFLSRLDVALGQFAEGRKELSQMASDAMMLAYEERDELAAEDMTEAVLLEGIADDLAAAARILARFDLRKAGDLVARSAHMANRDPSKPLGR